MSDYSPKPINMLLTNTGDGLSQLFRTSARLQQLNQRICKQLPPPLDMHCQVTNLRDNMLILQTDAAVWATRLRYHIPRLLEFLDKQQDLKHIHNIRVKVMPRHLQETGITTRRVTVNENTAALITSLADSMVDPAMKEALQRLAKHRGSTD